TERVARPFETLFVLQDFTRFTVFERLMLAAEDEQVQCGALTLSPYRIDQQEGQLELSLEIWPRGDGLLCAWRYDTELFAAATVEAWADDFAAFAAAIAAEPMPAEPVGRLRPLEAERRLRDVREVN